MKQRFLFIIPVILFTFLQCGNDSSPEAITKQIAILKEKKLQIENDIQKLEQQLAGQETVTSNLLKVKVKDCTPELFTHYLNLTARAEAEEEARVTPETSGIIESISVSIGDRVKKGDVLALLNTDVLDNSIAEIKVSLELANTTYEKQRMLWEQKVGSEIQYLQAKNQKESLERKLETLETQRKMAKVVAPFSGIINKVDQKEGELATPQKSLLYIVNPEKLKIKADVPENYSGVIQRGKPVEITFPSIPGIDIRTSITRKGSVLNFATRTFETEVMINNPDHKILPNQIANIRLSDYENKSAFTLPALSIKKDRDGYFIFIVVQQGNQMIAKKHYVQIGLSYDEVTEITKGLSQGDKVIVDGFSLVSNGQEVDIV